MVEITLYSVWTKKKEVKLFATSREALDYRFGLLRSGVAEEYVSRLGRHPIKIEDAVREEPKDA